ATDLFELVAQVALTPGGSSVELPAGVTIERVYPDPEPRVRIKARTERSYDAMLPARLSFSYEGVLVPHDKRTNAIMDRERQRIVHRALERENELLARLLELGAQRRFDWRASHDEQLVVPARRLQGIVHALAAEGWHVEAEEKRYRAAERMEAGVRSGIDWFELHGAVHFGEQRFELPQLLAALQRGDKTVQLDDGSHGILPDEWLRRYLPAAALAVQA